MDCKRIALCLSVSLASFSVWSDKLSFVTQNFAPFSYEIGDKPAGPAVDIVNAACMKADIKCEIYVMDWPKAQSRVYSGLSDGLFLIGKNKLREKLLYISQPIIKTEYGFFVKKSSSFNYTNDTDMSGLRVGVYGPSNTSLSLERLNKENKFKVEVYPHDEFAFLRLAAGKLDAVYSNRDVGYALISKMAISNIRYAGSQRSLFYHIGLSREFVDEKVAAQYMQAVSDIKSSGKISRILSKYTMEGVESQSKAQ
ncbi:substrate-binding periplasmic protein [Dongshaea marina]|uniref:substrate-binding periplasmic protein n=1 Tax=Dongshaea marina TaxID=2047966 RepID=UPI000D3E5B4F|nr:transporter substrate-binding domain-containing protein [Dongshaea marina]